MYNIGERKGDIRRLTSAHRALTELLRERKRLHCYLSTLLQRKRSRMEQIKQLKWFRNSTAECLIEATEVSTRLDAMNTDWGAKQEKQQSLQALALASADLKVHPLRC